MASATGQQAKAIVRGTFKGEPSEVLAQSSESLRDYLVRAFKPDVIALKLAELVGQKKVQTFVLDFVLEKEGIEKMCEDLQAEFLGARRIGGGKTLVYYLANEGDTQLRALDMIMKLHGAYAPERHEIMAGRALSGMTDEQLEAAIAEGQKVFAKTEAAPVIDQPST